MMHNTFVFPILGYFLEHRLKITSVNWEKIILFTMIMVSLILLSAYATYVRAFEEGQLSEKNSQSFFSCFNIVYATFVFLVVKKAVSI